MVFLSPGRVRLAPCEAHVCLDTIFYRGSGVTFAGKGLPEAHQVISW
jgi:hypothetical protein